MIKSFNEFINEGLVTINDVDLDKDTFWIGNNSVGIAKVKNKVAKHILKEIPDMKIYQYAGKENNYYMYLPRGYNILTFINLMNDLV